MVIPGQGSWQGSLAWPASGFQLLRKSLSCPPYKSSVPNCSYSLGPLDHRMVEIFRTIGTQRLPDSLSSEAPPYEVSLQRITRLLSSSPQMPCHLSETAYLYHFLPARLHPPQPPKTKLVSFLNSPRILHCRD